jgi:transcription elongation factor Elf1
VGGRKKRKTKIIKVKPKIPNMFDCPRCGRNTLSIEIEDGKAIINCGSCGLCSIIDVPTIFDKANIYGKFIDLYYEGKLEIKDGCGELLSEKSEESGELYSTTEE